jgi:hypothetical protein
MKGEARERWVELCAQAADEQDTDKLIELVREINDLLEEKEARLREKLKADTPWQLPPPISRLRSMADQATLERELSTRTGRQLWKVSLGMTGLLVVIGIVFLFLAKHYAWLR